MRPAEKVVIDQLRASACEFSFAMVGISDKPELLDAETRAALVTAAEEIAAHARKLQSVSGP